MKKCFKYAFLHPAFFFQHPENLYIENTHTYAHCMYFQIGNFIYNQRWREYVIPLVPCRSQLSVVSSPCLSRLVLCSMNSLGAELLKMGLNLPPFPTHAPSHFPPAMVSALASISGVENGEAALERLEPYCCCSVICLALLCSNASRRQHIALERKEALQETGSFFIISSQCIHALYEFYFT